MGKEYILAIDAGTTSSRSIIFDKKGDIVAVAQQEFRQIYPENGWVEHDPLEIIDTQIKTIKRVIEKAAIMPSQIVAIGITNQRETVVAWDKTTGK
ncbi:MAG TPA: FGGY family carbohydrate kinase, partial [Exilispira sp.]|nr:FGGY family carbohydrate kinase [Exilispira sp.]